MIKEINELTKPLDYLVIESIKLYCSVCKQNRNFRYLRTEVFKNFYYCEKCRKVVEYKEPKMWLENLI